MKIALIFLLFILTESKIPLEYKELADQALQNARKKVPKELREDTKYPGEYEGPGYHFTLKKTFTNSYTKDIKGFAANEKNVAIVKRKMFNIKDNFIFIDTKSQTLYKLKKTIASEDNIVIYESAVTDIFSLMTNFHMYQSTDEYVPINIKHAESKIPRLSLSHSFNWNQYTNKPNLDYIEGTKIQYGYGAYASFGLNTNFAFKSIKDIRLTISAKLDARIGAEIIVPDNTIIPIPDKVLLSLSKAIPGIGFRMKFLGLELSLGGIFHFDVNLTDMSVNIPIGFDYYKGYQLTGSKYFQITPNSVTDSKWDIRLISYPENSRVDTIKKSILSASFIGTFNVVPSFSFGITIGKYKVDFQVGLVIQFKWKLEFDTRKCMMPYLKATIDIPIDMYYSFTGIKLFFVQIIKPKFSRKTLKHYRIGPLCINAPNTFVEGYNRFIQSKEDTYTPYFIQNSKFYEKHGSTQYQKQLRFRVLDSQSQLLFQHPFQYTTYGTSASTSVISFVAPAVPSNGAIEYKLYYKDSQNTEKKAGYMFSNSLSSITTNPYSSNVVIPIDSTRTDITYFTFNFHKCELIEPGRIFKRSLNYIAFKPDPSYSGFYASVYFSEDGQLIQNTCDYTSSSWYNLDFREDSLYYQTDENINIKLTTISSSTDSFSAVINVYLNYKIKSVTKKVLIGIYETDVLAKGTIHNAEDIGLGSLSFDCYVPSKNQSTITIDGKITYQSKGTSTISPTTIYSKNNVPSTPEVTLSGTTKATFSITKTSPTVIADLYLGFVPVAQELVAETIQIYPNESQTITINFRQQEIYKIIDIVLPYSSVLNSDKNKYMLFYTEDGSDLRFLNDNSRKTYNEKCCYWYVSTQTYIQIPIRRDETEEKSYNINIEFLRHDTFTNNDNIEFLNQEKHTTIKFDNTVQSAFIVPEINGVSWFVADGPPNLKYIQKKIQIDDDTALILRKYLQITSIISYDFYLCYSEMTEENPLLTIDLTYMSPLLSRYTAFPYYIYFPNGYKITAQDDTGKTLGTSEVNENGLALFSLSQTGNITFIPICKDNKGRMCQITYETPTSTGYHLIKYPNRDGISTTGCGFLSELIPVTSGQSFTYYKTYEEDIQKIREYSNDEIKLLIKIEDVSNPNILSDETNTKRRICLYKENSPNEIIPFSRKYFSDNYDDLLNALSITEEDLTETNQLDNDEDGCYVLDAYLLTNSKINTLPKEVCDLPSSSITNPNYNPNGGQDPTKPPQVSSGDPTKPPQISSDDPTKPPQVSSDDPTKPPQVSSDDPTKPPQVSSGDPTKPPQVSSGDPTKPSQVSSDDNKPPESASATEDVIISTPEATIPPVEINDTTIKDNFGIGNIDISEKTPEDIKQEIEDKFNNSASNTNPNDKVDQFITILYNGEKEIEFKNLSLNENQYVKVKNNAKVKLTSGDLNLLLDKTSSKVNINLNNNNTDNIKLSIKNMNECTVKFDTHDPEEKGFSIDSHLDIYNPISIEYGKNIESFEVTSINIHEYGQLKSAVPIQTKYLSAQPNTNCKLSKITISNEFNIAQAAIIELDDVSLNTSTLNLNLHTYISSNYEDPMLSGTFGQPPSKIVLMKSIEDDSRLPDDRKKFLIFRGTFTTTCNEWKDKINYGGIHFNDGVCDDIHSFMMLNEEKELNVLYNPDLKSNNKKKLTTGQIIGIVVGVILGIAVVVAVIVVVIIILKKRNNSSIDEIDCEEQPAQSYNT